MRFPFADPAAQVRSRQQALEAAVLRVVRSQVFLLGPETAALEEEFARSVGVPHAVAVGSGTDAITLTLRAFDIGAGAEVIAPSFTALATIAAIAATGATAVLVDCLPQTLCIDPQAVERAITPRTRALLPVHLYGQMATMAPLRQLAAQHKLLLVEDCAQAAGAMQAGVAAGAHGHAGCFSFYPTKNLGALGDGGIITVQDDAVAARLRGLRQYGWDNERVGLEVGANSRMDEIQAAVVRLKLTDLDADRGRRHAVAERYDDILGGIGAAGLAKAADDVHAYHLYVIRHPQRDAARAALAAHEVGSGVHYALPAHRHPGYQQHIRVNGPLTVTDAACNDVLSLPMYPELAAVADELGDRVQRALASVPGSAP